MLPNGEAAKEIDTERITTSPDGEEMRGRRYPGVESLHQSRRVRMLLIVSVCLLAAYFMTPVFLNKMAEGLIREDGLAKPM